MTILQVVFFSLLLITTLQGHKNTDFPCNKSVDLDYGGVYYDCKHKQLHKVPESGFINATTIDLRNNNIKVVENYSFEGVSSLKCLLLDNNRIDALEEYAFCNTPNLKVLSLSSNVLQLNNHSYPLKVFAFLTHLVELNVIRNKWSFVTNYPDCFLYLKSLKVLRIDAFADLRFGKKFRALQSLKLLIIHCFDLIYISNYTFINLSPLETLNLTNCPIQKLDENAFKPLNNLTSLILRNSKHIPIYSAIRSLHVFRGRNMTTVDFTRVYFVKTFRMSENSSNRILTKEILSPLTDVCIENLSLAHNLIMYIDANAFVNKTITPCLRNVDLSQNLLMGNVGILLMIQKIFNLHHIDISKQNRWPCREIPASVPHQNQAACSSSFSANSNFDCPTKYGLTTLKDRSERNHPMMVIALPPKLKVINARESSNLHKSLNQTNIKFTNSDKIEFIDASYLQLTNIEYKVFGLEHLKGIDLSGNDLTNIVPSFFDEYEALETLIVKGTGLDQVHYLSRLFAKLKSLEALDMSRCGLPTLPPDLCLSSKNLSSIILSENLLQKLPEFIQNIKMLSLLDISYNMITYINKNDRNIFDKLATTNDVSLKLKGNRLSCACETLDFISWLDTSTVHVDKEDDYQCVTEDGHPSNVSYIIYNYNMVWRRCVGKQWFYISMATMISLFLGLSLMWICITNKTKIKRFIIITVMGRAVVEPTRKDYAFDVYIGHCENDWEFVCGKLRQMLEVNIGLKLFLRDRDSHVSLPIADEIIRGIHTSWTTVLIITPGFTEDLWMSFIIERAIFESRYMPRRLILMLMGDVDITSLLIVC